jgi:RND family efflux transporter MFP subunit
MRHRVLLGVLAVALLTGCKQEAAVVPLTRVRVVTSEVTEFAPQITLTGTIAAQFQSDVAFRLSGKITERLVNVGDHVKADQIVARLDPEEQQADLLAAQAGVASAQAVLTQTTASFERQQALLRTGNTTRREHDQAEASMRSAQGQLDQARAQLTTATDQLSFTTLKAGADGIIVKQLAEAGQVVSQAQPVYVLAIDGDRDALFNVYEWALANVELDKGLDVSMVTDPNVKAVGTVRLVSPAVNANTMTVQIRFGIAATPAAMALGAVVNGAAPLRPRKVVLLPWEAVFEQGGKPAVWVVDDRASTVSLKPVTIDRYARDTIAVTGIEPGLTIVSAGGQLLRPGQKVETVAERKP